ncbi:Lsr2 family protein [Rhodococcus sp. BS-15]|uniref:histone-like nucleoid-structuring protein Lsr2 n=1 Tax=Rhodococcus sp. BS-15 TaxID=1304954 RepID=UPI000ADFD750|nr:Lsr2 family protein [Rhodococcus sp. BS-15]
MARQTRIEFSDDIDGKTIDVDELQVVSWSWLGVEYEFDTTATNLEKIETGRVPFSTVLEKSRKTGGRRRVGASAKAVADKPSKTAARVGSEQAGAIRDWARKNGHTVSDRGRIPAEIAAAFDKAH